MILDTFQEVFVWLGKGCNVEEKKKALEVTTLRQNTVSLTRHRLQLSTSRLTPAAAPWIQLLSLLSSKGWNRPALLLNSQAGAPLSLEMYGSCLRSGN